MKTRQKPVMKKSTKPLQTTKQAVQTSKLPRRRRVALVQRNYLPFQYQMTPGQRLRPASTLWSLQPMGVISSTIIGKRSAPSDTAHVVAPQKTRLLESTSTAPSAGKQRSMCGQGLVESEQRLGEFSARIPGLHIK